ncbi:MAG: hypothetical protein V4574_07150 [Pseudomonadota bacterium]
MRRIVSLVIFASIGIWAAAPAHAQKVFSGIEPAVFSKRWSVNEWRVWALPGNQCLSLSQTPGLEPFRFWGFRQSPGSRLAMIFGAIESARPRTVQMSFNDGGLFDYDAEVERFKDWDAYVISLQGNALSVFRDSMVMHSYVKGQKIFGDVSNSMRNLEKTMRKCLEWQQSH